MKQGRKNAQRGFGRYSRFRRGVYGYCNFLDPVPYLYDLSGTSFGVCLNPPAFRPFVGVIVVIRVANQKTVWGFVDNDASVAIGPD